MKKGFWKKILQDTGIVFMGISIIGMAFFYGREGKISKEHQEIMEAAKASISPAPVTEDFKIVVENGAKEFSSSFAMGKTPGKEMGRDRPKEKTGSALALERDEGEDKEAGKDQEGEISYDWDSLLTTNEDTIGWLSLPDSLIDFPVVSTSDNEFYLSHGFYKENSSAGCLFMDQNTRQEDFNRVIYGHNMGTGSKAMFSTLIQFSEESYFDNHPVFYFTECYGMTETYEIMAVVKYDVKGIGEWDFRTRNHETMEDYNRWFWQLEERAYFYQEPEKAPDKILVLATCDRREHGKDGRLIIIGGATSQETRQSIKDTGKKEGD